MLNLHLIKLGTWVSCHPRRQPFQTLSGRQHQTKMLTLVFSKPKVAKFHALWEKSNCQLRRFQDGKIRESVAIDNSHGPAYFWLAKLRLLLKIHLPGAGVTVHSVRDANLMLD